MAKNDKKMYVMVVVALCGMLASSVGVGMNTAGLFFTPVSIDLGISRGSISFTSTIVSIMSALVAMVLPKILNVKSFKPIVWISTLMIVGGTALLSICNSSLLLYIFNFIRGAGIGLSHFVMVTLVLNNWFRAKYSIVAGVVLSFSGIPGAVFSSLISKMIVSFGWRIGYLSVAGLMLIFSLPALLFPIALNPKACDMKAYGEDEVKVTVEKTQDSSDFKYTLPSYLFLLLYSILVTALPSVVSHIPSYAESIHFSSSTAALTLSFGLAMNVLSKILFGFLSDKIGVRYTVIFMCAVNLISGILLLNASSAGILLVGSLLFGTVFAATTTGNVLMTKELFKEGYDKAYPLINFLGAVFGAVATVLLGILYDVTGSYRMMFVLTVIFEVVSILTVNLAYIARKKEVK